MLGLYVHLPFCRSRCSYCSFASSTDLSVRNLYVEALLREIDARATGEKVDTVYFGGGTPSMLYRGGLTRILSAIGTAFSVESDAEITAEANPDSCSADFAAECADIGINRISLGLQSADDVLLESVGRPHTRADFLRALDSVVHAGILSASCDVMLGLPGDTLSGIIKTLDFVLSLPIRHVSAYALKAEEGTRLYDSGWTPDEDLQADMYETTCARLEWAGLKRYEVSNFARPGFESRHNRKYWTRENYLGFGAAAHSLYNDFRWENTPNVPAYIAGKTEISRVFIGVREAREEYIMLSLRTREGLDYGLLLERYGCDLPREKSGEIASLLSAGLLEKTDGGIKIAENAFYVMNSILLRLL